MTHPLIADDDHGSADGFPPRRNNRRSASNLISMCGESAVAGARTQTELGDRKQHSELRGPMPRLSNTKPSLVLKRHVAASRRHLEQGEATPAAFAGPMRRGSPGPPEGPGSRDFNSSRDATLRTDGESKRDNQASGHEVLCTLLKQPRRPACQYIDSSVRKFVTALPRRADELPGLCQGLRFTESPSTARGSTENTCPVSSEQHLRRGGAGDTGATRSPRATFSQRRRDAGGYTETAAMRRAFYVLAGIVPGPIRVETDIACAREVREVV
ncbi:hypothetical protein AAFF_G00030250 [Aldrovandia affinis]|uniref:Uncharacterized protein n=1 Tax=Aldrovandia affinis TaxID=143900 RepID=A0AAD7S3Y5_9TELE|nr:hypothetical protein AAFF_G00030250 [Aldrovandia affinis]